MADENHLEILQQGIKFWNEWRSDNPKIEPNFRDVNLRDTDLRGADLRSADLRGADLSGADLSGADLYEADLVGANLVGANLDGADLYCSYLDGANLKAANLSVANLRGADLRGAILSIANLKGADLRGVDLGGANLYGTDLNNAYLNRVQALKANFEGATLTGACIEDWNINSQTNLQNVKCNYVYLKYIYSEEDKKQIKCDRRPHDPDKIFAPGEFTQLFQKALETVDLIFSEGIEWTAFLESFQKLQAEVKSEELSIQAIEKKSGSAFVIRLEVPQEANKAEIEKYIKQEYDAKLTVIEANYQKQLQAKNETIQAKNDELIKAYRETGTDLLKMAEIMSSFQQNTIINNSPNLPPGNIYNIEKAGIGHNDNSNISGNAKIAGEINEAEQEDLTEDE
ncbi:MAG: pentapeptide repeat-containing protein [Cyanobacteria bacterium P01_G01_bin.67]